jgi:hypothetical protein
MPIHANLDVQSFFKKNVLYQTNCFAWPLLSVADPDPGSGAFFDPGIRDG